MIDYSEPSVLPVRRLAVFAGLRFILFREKLLFTPNAVPALDRTMQAGICA